MVRASESQPGRQTAAAAAVVVGTVAVAVVVVAEAVVAEAAARPFCRAFGARFVPATRSKRVLRICQADYEPARRLCLEPGSPLFFFIEPSYFFP